MSRRSIGTPPAPGQPARRAAGSHRAGTARSHAVRRRPRRHLSRWAPCAACARRLAPRRSCAGVEAQSPFLAELRREIVAAIRREEDRNAQATAGGRLDEAPHQGRCQFVGPSDFGWASGCTCSGGRVAMGSTPAIARIASGCRWCCRFSKSEYINIYQRSTRWRQRVGFTRPCERLPSRAEAMSMIILRSGRPSCLPGKGTAPSQTTIGQTFRADGRRSHPA